MEDHAFAPDDTFPLGIDDQFLGAALSTSSPLTPIAGSSSLVTEPLIAGTQGDDYHGPLPGLGLRPSCQLCRRKHTRCDGSINGCAACLRAQIQCVYEPMCSMGRPRQKPGAPPVPSYTRQDPAKNVGPRYKNKEKQKQAALDRMRAISGEFLDMPDSVNFPPPKKKQKTTGLITRFAFELPLGMALKEQLAADWINVTQKSKLVGIPRATSVTNVLDQYYEHVLCEPTPSEQSSRSPERVEDIIRGLQGFFNILIGPRLLYEPEKAQHEWLLRQDPNTNMIPFADIYGPEHLLRLFVELPEYIIDMNLEPEEALEIHGIITDLLIWLADNLDIFLPAKDYEDADEVHSAMHANGDVHVNG